MEEYLKTPSEREKIKKEETKLLSKDCLPKILACRDEDSFDVWDLLHDFQAHGPLASKYVGMIVSIDVHQTSVATQFEGVLPALR